jgi:succinate dehydrogenase/fumarate reductase flavoprotein subunit
MMAKDDTNPDRQSDANGHVDRRSFLRSGAAVVGSAAALTGLDKPAAAAEPIKWDREVDVVVIGAGASGLPAAIAARDGGASVIILEQHFDIGGCAIISGGTVHIGAGNKIQVEKGVKDSPDLVFADWTRPTHKAARYNDRDLVRRFADENLATFDFLNANGVQWESLSGPQSASTVPRQITAVEWPIRSQLVAFDQKRNGSGVVRPLEMSARKKGVEILLQHKMTSVVREGNLSGRVLGVTAVQVDRWFQPTYQTLNVRARKGVILATGGHGGNIELRRVFDPRLTPEYQAHGEDLAPHNGDGEIAAMSIGASLWATANQTNEAGAALNKGRLGVQNNYVRGRFTPESPNFFRARASGQNVRDWQNLILVKENGKRFYDETKENYDYHAAALEWSGDPKKLNGGGPIWAIFDADAVEREKWKTDFPYVDRVGGYFFSAATLLDLAGQLTRNEYQGRPMPGAALQATVERFNSFVDSGADADFKRPSPMFKIAKPPFYAAWATPCLHDALTGLRTNTKCEVIDIFGKVIPCLYAVGETQGGFQMHGLARCIVFGRLAGMGAAAQA